VVDIGSPFEQTVWTVQCYDPGVDAGGKRERILDALQDLLVEQGPGAVTLEAVAARARVSKGGLLHYFRSKEALLAGLVERAAVRLEADPAPRGAGARAAIEAYVAASSTLSAAELPLHRTLVATLRGSTGADDEIARSVAAVVGPVSARLHEEIGDPVLAETVRLVGDGLLLAELVGLPGPDPALRAEVTRSLLDRCAPAGVRSG
jgi:AcrR family transcriptional regulator